MFQHLGTIIENKYMEKVLFQENGRYYYVEFDCFHPAVYM